MSKKVTKVGFHPTSLGEEFDQKDLDKLLYHWFREANGLLQEINGSLEEINTMKKKTNKFNDNSKKTLVIKNS